MNQVSKDGQHKIFYYARARAWMRYFVPAALWLVISPFLKTVQSETLHSLRATELKASLKTEKNKQKRSRLYDDISRLEGSEAESLLEDPDAKTRESAVLAIGRDKEYSRAQTKLKDLAKNDDDISVRAVAIQSLGSHHEGYEDLKTVLESETEPLPVREAAASALALFPEQDAAQELARVYGQSQDELKEHIQICLEGLRNRHPELINSVLGEPDEK